MGGGGPGRGGPVTMQMRLEGLVWIDIRPRNGLETACPGRQTASGIDLILPLSGAQTIVPHTAFQSTRIIL
jgi:hypothetical protein